MAQMSFLICSAVWLLTVHLWGLLSADGAPDRPHHDTKHSWDALQRQKRNWVWNQFFVLEEYTGTDPLYVGKVRSLISHMKVLLCFFLNDHPKSLVFRIMNKCNQVR